MNVVRSAYYKWLNKSPNQKLKYRESVAHLVIEIHEKHKSHGYRWVNAKLYLEHKIKCSDNFIYTIFKEYDLKCISNHRPFSKRKKENKWITQNEINGDWSKVTEPYEVIVSDMTAFWCITTYFELTLYFDVYTKIIVAYELTDRRGWREPYIKGLETVLAKIKEERHVSQVSILHTDQGSVYSSKAYNELYKDYNIIRSMSRPGKPTDNPMDESFNGWIKDELFNDYHIDEAMPDEVPRIIDEYVHYYNYERPAYSLKYDVPMNFYKKYLLKKLCQCLLLKKRNR